MGRLKSRLADLGIAAVALIIALVLFIGALTMDVRGTQVPGPQFFPFIVSGLLFVFGIILLVGQVLAARKATVEEAEWHNPDVSEDMLRSFGANTELLQVDEAVRLAEEERVGDAATTSKAAAVSDDVDTAHPVDWKTVGIVVGAIVVFIVLLEFAGWLLSGTIMFWLIAFAFGNRKPLTNLGVALIVASLVQLLFVAGLGLTLPSGFVGVLF